MKTVLSAAVTLFLAQPLISAEFDWSEYKKLLSNNLVQNVRLQGIGVNALRYGKLYTQKKNKSSRYNKILNNLAHFNPESLPSRKSKIAFWINAYNIGAVNLVLKHYPVDSIRSFKISLIKNPWKKPAIKINNREYSLHTIEHVILLGKYRMVKSHFAIVCASISCPDLAPAPYTAKNLNHLIKKRAIYFLNSRKGIYIDKSKGRVFVSKIFKWDKKNFPKGKDSIIPFILPYIKDRTTKEYLKAGSFELEFLPYNWDLNRVK